jgi:hypothetical protein
VVPLATSVFWALDGSLPWLAVGPCRFALGLVLPAVAVNWLLFMTRLSEVSFGAGRRVRARRPRPRAVRAAGATGADAQEAAEARGEPERAPRPEPAPEPIPADLSLLAMPDDSPGQVSWRLRRSEDRSGIESEAAGDLEILRDPAVEALLAARRDRADSRRVPVEV